MKAVVKCTAIFKTFAHVIRATSFIVMYGGCQQAVINRLSLFQSNSVDRAKDISFLSGDNMAQNTDIVYKKILSVNYLKKMVAEHRSFSSLVQRAPYDIISVVATHQKRPIAFIFGIVETCCHRYKLNAVRGRSRTKELYVEYIVVDDEFRNRGIGTELMKRFEAVAFESNIQKIRLFVEESKKYAISLYEKRGFSIDGDSVGTLIQMAKKIAKPLK